MQKSRKGTEKTIELGGELVPVVTRDWVSGEREPYRKTYSLKPGQHWLDAEVTPNQWEHYVVTRDGQIPVGAMIARELIAEGALVAAFTEIWGRFAMVNEDLICITDDHTLAPIIDEIRESNGGLAGLPDVIAVLPDGTIAFREAKNIAAKDKLSRSQHDMAMLLRRLYGARLDLAVVQWGHPMPGESIEKR